jgi:predicted RNase H-like HicB family nuclease
MQANKYPAQVFFSEEDEGFIAVAPDLPGCSAFGATQEEALTELQTAIEVWAEAATKAGNPVPAPSNPHIEPLPSGKVLVRMPRTLHQQLIDRASFEGTSLNQLVIMLLSAGVSVRTVATGQAARGVAMMAVAGAPLRESWISETSTGMGVTFGSRTVRAVQRLDQWVFVNTHHHLQSTAGMSEMTVSPSKTIAVRVVALGEKPVSSISREGIYVHG